ncbi:hypothetical protein ACERK3_06555 [Phycisphaerales bacterium AB-hyl4]|uniref:Uncharacterized protein n=1 Tax=Natronomicrosphaera hydrolytica TaxID=3242702 RepID=A0ABV4U540_9BACT
MLKFELGEREMHAIDKALGRARLRLLLCRAVWWLGVLTLAGLAAAAALLLAERLFLAPIAWWAYAIVAGVVVLATPVLAWRGLPGQAQVAELLDDRLHLKDRLSTALYVRAMADQPFARQVMVDAEQAADRLSVREALPVRGGRAWNWTPVGVAVFGLLALLVPAEVDVLGLNQRQAQQAADDAQADEAQQRIVEASAHMPDPSRMTDEAEAARAEDLLNQLAELSQRDLRNPDIRRDAQAQLSRLQDRIASEREQQERTLRTMRNAMSRIDPGQSGPANRFADALRRGEFASAQRELDELSRAVREGSLSESEQQALQQQLRNMSDQLEQSAEQHRQRQEQTQEQMREQLREQGLSDEQIDDLQQQNFDQQAVEDALREEYEQQDMDREQAQQQAREQAERTQQQQQQSQQDSQAGEMCDGLGGSMSQMADALDPQGQQQGQQGQDGQQQQAQQGEDGQPQQGQQQAQNGQQAQDGGQGQSGQQGQGFDQGSWQGQQQLDQISQMQQALKDMGVSEQQLQDAMQQLSQQQQQEGDDGGGGQQQDQSQQQQAGVGEGAGSGSAGPPLGEERRIGEYQTQARDRSRDGQGRIIASWHEEGEMTADAPTIEYDQAVSEARSDAERAVSEDRVPRRYHGAIREYFKQLPESADETRRAPATP